MIEIIIGNFNLSFDDKIDIIDRIKNGYLWEEFDEISENLKKLDVDILII